MEDIFVIEHIKELCKQRDWSYYKLASMSEIPYSSINTMMNKQHVPSMKNLIKICNGFNMTLSQFFISMEDITNEQDEIISLWNQLNSDDKYHVKIYISGLLKRQAPFDNQKNKSKR